jgi:hypothetical protein
VVAVVQHLTQAHHLQEQTQAVQVVTETDLMVAQVQLAHKIQQVQVVAVVDLLPLVLLAQVTMVEQVEMVVAVVAELTTQALAVLVAMALFICISKEQQWQHMQ